MNREEITTILKGLIGKNKSTKLHFTCTNGRFYNGVFLNVDKDEDFISITDMKYGYTIIPFSLIVMINLYREKEND